jgi:hypothetical protein
MLNNRVCRDWAGHATATTVLVLRTEAILVGPLVARPDPPAREAQIHESGVPEDLLAS